MRALKIMLEGSVTSFRYPHFVQGVHPTFDMPPPATIYGHVCSAVGKLIDRNATRFAYCFTYATKFVDYEHTHFPPSEMNKDQRALHRRLQEDFRSVRTPPSINPFQRELLFQPVMTLYLSNMDYKPYFDSPAFPVALGRSQDLMTYVRISEVELQPASRAFYSGTLLPLEDAAKIGGASYAVTMPRFISERREPTWAQYAVLPHSLNPPIYPDDDGLQFEDAPLSFSILVDPEPDAAHPYIAGLQRGVVWHEW